MKAGLREGGLIEMKTGILDRNIGDRKMEMTYTIEIICGLPGEVLWNFQTI